MTRFYVAKVEHLEWKCTVAIFFMSSNVLKEKQWRTQRALNKLLLKQDILWAKNDSRDPLCDFVTLLEDSCRFSVNATTLHLPKPAKNTALALTWKQNTVASMVYAKY